MSKTMSINAATTTAATTATPVRYLAPGFATRRIANPLMAAITRLGLSPRGSRVLHVRGRSSGQWHTVPVNPLSLDGHPYLVAPRGETQWVRNLRAAGTGRLQLGRRVTEFRATEVTDLDAKATILQAYVRIWRSEVGTFFDGVDSESIDALRSAAPGYPVFTIDEAEHGASSRRGR